MVDEIRVVGSGEGRRLSAELLAFADEQLPFAMARALTVSAQEVLRLGKSRMPDRFTIRARRMLSTYQVVRAEKRDWPRPMASVGIRDEFMARHEEGGVVKPARSSTFAIPVRVVAKRRGASGAIPKNLKPRSLISEGKATIDRADGEIEKTSKLRAKGIPDRLRRLFTLRPTIKLQPRLGLRLDANEVMAGGFFDRTFRFSLEAAIRSRRVRKGSFTSEQARGAFVAAKARTRRDGGA